MGSSHYKRYLKYTVLVINSLLTVCLLVRMVFFLVNKMPAKQIYLFTSPVVILLSACMAIASKSSVSFCLCLAIMFGDVFVCSLHILAHRCTRRLTLIMLRMTQSCISGYIYLVAQLMLFS